MTLPIYNHIPKQDLARSLLDRALLLYMLGQEYPAVITLAGAAEEILGKIAISKDIEPSLKRKLRQLLVLFKDQWGNDAEQKDFVRLRNRARNYLKHFDVGEEDLQMDYEHEAASMLSRALENFHLCAGVQHPEEFTFTRRRTANWRAKQKQIRRASTISTR